MMRSFSAVFEPLRVGQDADAGDFSGVVGQGLTLRDWLTAGGTLLAFLIVARLLRMVVTKVVARTDTEGTIAQPVGKIVQQFVVFLGVIYSLNALSVQIGPLLGALGITGIAIAFALTAILENVFASVVLKTRRPLVRGDQVSAVGHSGTVEEINFRTVILRSFDGEKVIIPSSDVNSEPLVNHTSFGPRRSTIPISVAYNTHLPTAQDALLAAVESVHGVIDAPAPDVLCTAFGDSSIDFDVRFWHEPDIATTLSVRSSVAMALKAGLDAANIEIPFPQRVVTMVRDAAADRDPDRTSDQSES